VEIPQLEEEEAEAERVAGRKFNRTMLLLMLMLLLACQLRNFSFFLFFSFPAGFKTGRGGRVRFYTKLFFFLSLLYFSLLVVLCCHLFSFISVVVVVVCPDYVIIQVAAALLPFSLSDKTQHQEEEEEGRRRKKRKPKKIYFNSSSKTFKFLLSFPPSELYVCIYTRCATVQAFLAGPSSAYIETMLAVGLPSATQKTRPPCIYLSIPPSSPLSFLYRVFFLYIAGRVHIYMYVWYRVFIKWEDLIHFPGRWIYDTTLSMRDMIILNVLH
jgi:hypothetical protein